MFVASDVAALVALHPPGRAPRRRRAGHGHAPTASAPSRQDDRATAKSAGDGRRGTPRRTTSASHAHFMHKEIARAAATPSSARCAAASTSASAPPTSAGSTSTPREARAIRRVKILGCGSAYYAGQMGAQLIEELARIPADAEPASRVPLPQPGHRARHPLRRGQPVRRDRRHPRRRAGDPAQGRPGDRPGQRRRLDDRPRVRRRHLPARRARRSRSPRPRRSPTWSSAFALLALHLGRVRDLVRRRRQAAHRGPAARCPAQIAGDPRAARTRSPRSPRELRRAPSSLFFVGRVPRLPGGPRGRAEAQGDLLPSTPRPTRPPSSSTARWR